MLENCMIDNYNALTHKWLVDTCKQSNNFKGLIIGQTADRAENILKTLRAEFFNDPEVAVTRTGKYVRFKNGSYITVRNNSPESIRGVRANCVLFFGETREFERRQEQFTGLLVQYTEGKVDFWSENEHEFLDNFLSEYKIIKG